MASGKASRRKRKRDAEQLQASVVEKTPPAAGAKRWVLLSIAAAVAVAIALGVALAPAGGTSPQPSEGSTLAEGPTLPNAADAVAAFAGIPQRGNALGRAKAPVTIVEFVDLQCPYCRDFVVEAMPMLIEKYVRTGKARLEVRGLAFLGPDSERGMRATFAAAEQGRMFELMELLYYNQGAENSGWLTQELVEAAARSVRGVDAARLVADMESDSVSKLLHHHAEEAERREVSATPTILVGPTGGKLAKVTLGSPTDAAAVEQAIAAALNP